MPGRKHRNKPIKDSGSSGPDPDKSSGSKKSEKTKSREKIARKPSKELLRIQNYTDSSDDDFRFMARFSKRHSSRSNDTRSYSNDNKEDKTIADATSSKTDIASSLSPSSSKRSPNVSSRSPKANQSPKRSSRTSRQSPETLRRKTPPPQTKSLNMQIHEFVQHSSRSPPKSRKKLDPGNHFDAFNHTSSQKLAHASFKEHEKSPSSKQSSLSHQQSSQYSESFEDYEIYHPRRSSKEVLDFTSSRKSLHEARSSENEQYPKKQHSKEERGNTRSEEGQLKKKEEHRHCQCLSPRKEMASDVRSPSMVREDKEVFDFTSKKLSQYSSSTLSRKSRARDHKYESSGKVKDSDIYGTLGPRKDDRNTFDKCVGDGSEYATLRKKKHSRHKHSEILDFTSSAAKMMETASPMNTSQELLKSSTEILVSKTSSREMISSKPEEFWSEPSQSRRGDTKRDDYDSIGDSPTNSKDDLSSKDLLRETTIDPPDLFNTNLDVDKYRPGFEMRQSNTEVEEPTYISRSATLKHSHKHRSKRIRNRSLEMVLDEVDSRPRYWV